MTEPEHSRLPIVRRCEPVPIGRTAYHGPVRGEGTVVDRVVIRPRADGGGVEALQYGELSAVIAACEEAEAKAVSTQQHPGAGASGRWVWLPEGAATEGSPCRRY